MKIISMFFGLVVMLLAILLFLRGRSTSFNQEMPLFLRTDPIAETHRTSMTVMVHSPYRPSDRDIERLKRDYAAIWAHLNHLYASNDVVAGKEYYTEAWFRQICRNKAPIPNSVIERQDLNHKLHISNWSTDDLVCTAVDSSITFSYRFAGQTIKTTSAIAAVALLFRGDHWRLDAIRIIHESPIDHQTKRL